MRKRGSLYPILKTLYAEGIKLLSLQPDLKASKVFGVLEDRGFGAGLSNKKRENQQWADMERFSKRKYKQYWR